MDSNSVVPNPVLTEYLLRYRNDGMNGMIAPMVSPIAKVPYKLFKTQAIDISDLIRVDTSTIVGKGVPKQIDYTASQTAYSVEDHYFEHAVDRDDQGQAVYDLLQVGTQFVGDKLALEFERDVANVVFTAGNYPASNKVTLGTSWDQTSATPIADVLTGMEACLKEPNVLVMGSAVWRSFRRHPQVLDAIKGSGSGQPRGGVVSPQDVANFFWPNGNGQCLVGMARYNNVVKGQTDSIVRLWGKFAAVLHIVPQPQQNSISFMATFSETPSFVGTYFNPQRGPKGADIVKAGWNRLIQILYSTDGYLISNATA